ncbi:MAG: serine/threonine protein kinase [Clostridiales bacterium]|nr:serine/threonine protein kinase [Clostridiales bacterium]
MDTSKLCYGCFGEHDGVGPCPHCGFDLATAKHPFVALPIGTILNGRYLTGRVLGVGGFGVTYLAFDMTLEINVAIKEFLPSGIALRDADRYTMTVSSPEEQPKFDTGATKFLDEARLLAKLRDVPNVVTVQDYFRENNTAYFVMEYIEGVDLMKYTQSKGGKLSFNEALYLILPIINSLAHVHAHNLLHRDISPDNIVVMKNGSTRLLDFGAARLAIDSEKSKSIILKHGFAPEEQYRKHGNQGPWSDEYALAATMYLIMTGVMPPDAIERVHEDTLVPPIQLGVDIPQYANDALMKALSVNASGRFPDMASFSEALTGRKITAPASPYSLPVAGSDSGDVLPTAATGVMEGNMVQGKTVAMDQEGAGFTPQKMLSPSILAGSVSEEQQPSGEQEIVKPKAKKKSIWKRPLTYIVAGIVALAGAAVPVGYYISQNYEWGEVEEETTKKTSKNTKKTSKTTPTTSEETIPDPEISDNGELITYNDKSRLFSVSAASNYKFENKNGLFCLVREDGECSVYTDMITSMNDCRIDSLCDFVAQSDEIISAYVTDTLGFQDMELSSDDFTVVTLAGNTCALEYDGSAIRNGKRIDLTFLVAERKEDKGVFIDCGVMPLDENNMYSGSDWDEIKAILVSFCEASQKESDYIYFDEPGVPHFLYRKSSVESAQARTMGNSIDFYELSFKDIGSKEDRVFLVPLGNQSSITVACTSFEQALGSEYKIGGYSSVTPTVRKELEMRIRDYALTRIDDEDGKTLQCTACVINFSGTYYAVVAICDDEASMERIALDFTLVVKSLTDY